MCHSHICSRLMMVVLRNNFFSATAPNNAHYTNFVYVFVSHGTRTKKKETKQGKTGRQDIRNAFYQHLFDTSNAYTYTQIHLSYQAHGYSIRIKKRR